MGEKTKIQWADHTWNPWIGCSRVHTGCDNCYAEAMAGRWGVTWGPNGTRRLTSGGYWQHPRRWNQQAERDGVRRRVFPSLCDPFEDFRGRVLGTDNGEYYGIKLTDVRRDMFRVIDQTPWLDWLLLTKRPESIRRMWPKWTLQGHSHPTEPRCLRNAWLIYSASNQETLEAGLPHLLKCRALTPVLGLSIEPLVGPLDLERVAGALPEGSETCNRGDDHNAGRCECSRGVDWVIVGGESGSNARSCNVEWIRSIVRQCKAAGVPCFVKQLGSHVIDTATGLDWPDGARMGYDVEYGSGARIVLRDNKGGDPSEWPDDIRVQELPVIERN